MRILVTGAGGQLGREVCAQLESAGHHELIAADHARLDVCDRDAVMQAVTSSSPDAVVNCAAYTAVDACESDHDGAWLGNALAVRFLRDACAIAGGAHLLTVSTDYVFDGTQADPYVEWDAPNPVSMYGRSKRGGELEALAYANATVMRTSWVCGQHGGNMVKTILRLAGEHDTLSFVDDQRGHPSFADDLATMVVRLIVERRTGLFHVTNQGAVSWFEFAQEVLRAAGLDAERVKPIATVDLQPPRPAPRPANSVLDNAALRLEGIPLLADFREPLARLVKTLT